MLTQRPFSCWTGLGVTVAVSCSTITVSATSAALPLPLCHYADLTLTPTLTMTPPAPPAGVRVRAADGRHQPLLDLARQLAQHRHRGGRRADARGRGQSPSLAEPHPLRRTHMRTAFDRQVCRASPCTRRDAPTCTCFVSDPVKVRPATDPACHCLPPPRCATTACYPDGPEPLVTHAIFAPATPCSHALPV